MARTSVDAQSVLPSLVATMHQIDPGIATFGAATMEQRIHDSPPEYLHRASAWLVGSFAALALLLSVVGLYGVIAYSVSQRTREIGVRIALGAQRGNLLWLVMRQAGVMLLVGVFIGLGLALASGRLVRGFLYGVKAHDGWTLAGAALLLFASGMLAAWLPARRAARVNPMEALRAE